MPDPADDPYLRTAADEAAALAAWRAAHPSRPIKGLDGGGGFIGWANRLDRRVGLLKSPEQVVPIRARDIFREMVRPPTLWLTIALTASGIALAVAFPPLGRLDSVLALTVVSISAAAARRRRMAEIRREVEQRDLSERAPVLGG